MNYTKRPAGSQWEQKFIESYTGIHWFACHLDYANIKRTKLIVDIKLFMVVKNKPKCNEIQKFVLILNARATKWNMQFNADKQKLLNNEKYNPNLQ